MRASNRCLAWPPFVLWNWFNIFISLCKSAMLRERNARLFAFPFVRHWNRFNHGFFFFSFFFPSSNEPSGHTSSIFFLFEIRSLRFFEKRKKKKKNNCTLYLDSFFSLIKFFFFNSFKVCFNNRPCLRKSLYNMRIYRWIICLRKKYVYVHII